MNWRLALCLLLAAVPGAGAGTNDPEVCDQCQKVLYIASVYYNKQRSKPFLRRKVRHLCKRYYEYRRHCLATLVPSSETIAHSIDAALDQGEYHPFRTCALVQECTGDSDPMKFDDIDLDDLEGSGLDLFFDID